MITGKGAGFLAAALALFILGRLTQVGWLYLMDAVLWGIILVSAAVPWLNVFPPRALRWIEKPDENGGPLSPSEGDPVAIRITLRNPTFWPRYVIGLFYDCPLKGPGSHIQRFFVTELAGFGQTLQFKLFEGVDHFWYGQESRLVPEVGRFFTEQLKKSE